MTALTATSVGPEQRGGLVVAQRVVEKVAAQAVIEVAAAGGPPAFAVRPGLEPGARPQVAVQLDGSDAWLTVEVGLVYPGPLRAAADGVRTYLVERVEQLTGVRVRRLDIRVGWLAAADAQPRLLT